MSIRDKTARNIGIVAVLQVFASTINAVTFIILARLLLPYDFGIVGIAAVVLGIISQFSDFGLGPAVIQRQSEVEEALYTGGTLRILIALALFITAFLTADLAAWIYQTAEVANVIRVAALMFFLTSAGFVSTTRLTKELEFGRLAVVTAVNSVVSALASIIIAWFLRSYWAMVIGPIIGSVGALIVLYIVCPWKARFHIDRRIAKELLGYGKHVLLMLLLVFLIFHLDDAFIGAFLGLSLLGYYYVAYRWSSYVANFLTKLVYRVMFPTYSHLQKQAEKLKKGYLETLDLLSLVSFPLYFALMIVAPEFVTLFLGDHWMPSVLPLQILCFFGLMRTLTEPAGNVLLAVGKSRILSSTNFINLIILLAFIFPALGFGLEGVSILIVGMYFSHMVILLWFVTRNLDLSLGEIAETFRGPILASLLMLISMLVVKMFLTDVLISFVITSSVGISVYLVIIYAYEGSRIRYYWNEMKKMLAREPH